MTYGNREGIARFGMGMKTAALSMSPVLEVYSWQEPEAIYTMTLDVEAIGKDRANLVELPDPTLITELSDEIAELFRKPLSYPANRAEQQLLAADGESVADNLGPSGTIVYMPDCDRLHYAKTSTLVDHAVKEMARVYRRAIAGGTRLYVNNRLIEAFDCRTHATSASWISGRSRAASSSLSQPRSRWQRAATRRHPPSSRFTSYLLRNGRFCPTRPRGTTCAYSMG
jgi:Histidine kinase-, DNA gyrase B-, and HSP90-like ATPase